MTGSSVFDYIHHQDHSELAEQLGLGLASAQTGGGSTSGLGSPGGSAGSGGEDGSGGTQNPDGKFLNSSASTSVDGALVSKW